MLIDVTWGGAFKGEITAQVSIMVTSLEMACLSSALVPLAGQKKKRKKKAGGRF